MFPLYAILIGLVVGVAFGGTIANLGRLQFRWAGLALAGLLAQVVLFAEPVAARVGDVGPPIYVASSVVVLVALLRNLHISGLRIMAVGAVSNLAAIVANGGSMPATPDALAALGKSVGEAYSNSVVAADPALAGLTDIYALPSWLPFANVFSIGDALIGAGMALAIVAGMRAGISGARRHWHRGHPVVVPMTHGSGAEPPIGSG
ncbi:MAG: DUF5317 family protein [Candidatus Limnocylindria bacterium]